MERNGRNDKEEEEERVLRGKTRVKEPTFKPGEEEMEGSAKRRREIVERTGGQGKIEAPAEW